MTNKTIVVFHYLKENYTVSYSVLLMFKMYYLLREHFMSQGYNIMTLIDFIDNPGNKEKISNIDKNMQLTDNVIKDIMNRSVDNFINQVITTDKFDGSFVIGHHPAGFDYALCGDNYNKLKSKGIKILLWHDDLHVIWRNQKKTWTDKVTDQRFDRADKIITPSKRFYFNLGHPYANKTEFYFYCFNEKLYKEIPINNFQKRKPKILLSGALGPHYNIRFKFYNHWRFNKLTDRGIAKYIDVLTHPGYDRQKNKGRTGLGYYKHMAGYRAAIFGFCVQPINYPLAKIIEILACGTLGFFEYNKSLDNLGLVKFKHYVPIKMNNLHEPEFDRAYYMKYLLTEEGEKIANEGCKFVREKFTMKNRADQLIKILDKL